MRTAEEVDSSIRQRFYDLTGKNYRSGSMIGYFSSAISDAIGEAYQEIEDAKNPHIYTNLSGDNLDKMGTFVNVPRQPNETDETYLYRIMNWTALKSGANLTAVNSSILNLEYSSNAEYHPGIYGAGTGAVYVIPNVYDDDTIKKALTEVKDRLYDVISPESYTEYIIPTPISVIVIASIESSNGDIQNLKNVINNEFKEYINAIPPNESLSIGILNRIGMNLDNVDYFNVNGIYLDGVYNTSTNILQNLETKMLFQEISWEE